MLRSENGAKRVNENQNPIDRAKRAERRTRESAALLSSMLIRTAEALEDSAALADEHGRTRARQGLIHDVAVEREAAERAREAAGQARAYAARWSEFEARSGE
jgi:hypothetical protein